LPVKIAGYTIAGQLPTRTRMTLLAIRTLVIRMPAGSGMNSG
jgi:hypothetical protein